MVNSERMLAILHAMCEGLLYAWLIGLSLPHFNAFYNSGLYGAPVVTVIYLVFSRGAGLSILRSPLFLAFGALVLWMLMACVWAPNPGRAFEEWKGSLGVALQMTMVFAVIFQGNKCQRRFVLFSLALGSAIIAMFCTQWVRYLYQEGGVIPPYPTMRFWGYALLLCTPFLLFGGEAVGSRIVVWLARGFAIVLACLMLVTATRGLWLGLGVLMLGAFVIYRSSVKHTVLLLSGVLLMFGALLALPNNPLKERVKKITYVSDRVTYTWGPALDFWGQSPVIGIGSGSSAFHVKAIEKARNDPSWISDGHEKSDIVTLGPHSTYLEVLAGSGMVGFILLVYFYAQVIRHVWRGLRIPLPLALAGGMGIIAMYMAHGFVESINWRAMGVLLGVMLASIARSHSIRRIVRTT